MKFFILSILVFLFARPVFSEPNQQEISEQSVIDPLYSENIAWEEASFTSQKKQRDIARVKKEKILNKSQWQDDLDVLDEIPYSYPQVSRSYLQKRVLAEMGYGY